MHRVGVQLFSLATLPIKKRAELIDAFKKGIDPDTCKFNITNTLRCGKTVND